jgi:hypothetical protein
MRKGDAFAVRASRLTVLVPENVPSLTAFAHFVRAIQGHFLAYAWPVP